jgi:hypothetical protein
LYSADALPIFSCYNLVHEEGLDLVALLAQLLVAAHEQDLRKPREQERSDRESRRRRERNDVARGIGLGPEVGRPIVFVSPGKSGVREDKGRGFPYQMKDAFMMVVTMPIATALFSGVWPHVEPHQPRISELTP